MGYKIYTKTGDTGKTSLFGGKRVFKNHERIEAYGTVDELNSFLGLLRDSLEDASLIESLTRIQNKLFDIGSYLASPSQKASENVAVKEANISWLEDKIDEMDSELPDLTNFILPGGHIHVSYAHICRTVCRRAERRVVALSLDTEINPFVIRYLNRLSDYFFVLGRSICHLYEKEEVKWEKDAN